MVKLPLSFGRFCFMKHTIVARAAQKRKTHRSSVGPHVAPVATVAYQVILEPGIGQFREFEPPRVHTRINSWGIFLVHKLTCGKRESVSKQHSMKDRRAVGLQYPMRDKK